MSIVFIPAYRSTHVHDKLLPVIIGESGRVNGPDDQLDVLGLALVNQEEFSGAYQEGRV